MPEFDPDLKRAFAMIEDPVDAGFAVGVARRVAHREQARSARVWMQLGAFLVAGGALAYGAIGAIQALGPGLMAEFGLGLAEAHGALSSGSLAAGMGALLTPLLLAAGAGIGGLAISRAVTE